MLKNYSKKLIAFYKNCPVLITGGNGFIGQHLNKTLGQLGAQVTNFATDIRDEEAVKKAVSAQKVIFHLAGHSGAVSSNKFPKQDLDVNCNGTLNLLEACRQLNPEARIIFPSSRLVYGQPTALPVTEAHVTCPTSIYGIHKLTCEHYFRLYHSLYGLSTVSLRITNPYGPVFSQKIRSYGIVNIFLHLALSNSTIKLFGGGAQLRDFIYIDDLIEIFLIAGQGSWGRGDVFNVCGHEAVSLREAADIIVSVVGRGKIEHVPWPSESKKVETGDFLADISKIMQTSNWQPRIRYQDGIKKTLAQIKRF